MLIDTHVHIGGGAVGFDMSEEIVETFLDKFHVDHILLSNCDCVEVDHAQKLLPPKFHVSQEDSLRRTLAFAGKYPDKISVGAWAKPLTEGLTVEFENLIKDNLNFVKAIKLHPFHSKTKPTDPTCLPYLELAAKYNLAVVSHTGNTECDDPACLYEAAKMFPTVSFVMVHMGLGSDNKLALDLLGKADNLYGDTTWVPMSTTLEAIKRYGTGKIMFGSDSPIDGLDTYLCNPKGERSLYQDYFHVLPDMIDRDAYEDLMWRNAARILKLDVK